MKRSLRFPLFIALMVLIAIVVLIFDAIDVTKPIVNSSAFIGSTLTVIGVLSAGMILSMVQDAKHSGLFSESKEDLIDRSKLVKGKKLTVADFESLLRRLGVDNMIIGEKEISTKQLLETIRVSESSAVDEDSEWEPEVEYELENSRNIGLEEDLVKKILSIHPIYNVGLQRLVRSKNAAEKRGLTNLWIGIALAVIGLLILGIRAVMIGEMQTDDMFIQFLPGAALGILMELLAFFFLRLYSKSLEESKYYANEITILEARFLGYFMATVHGDEDERKAIVADFGKYIRELPTLRSTPVLDKATTGALIDLVKSVATATKGGDGGG